MRRGASRCRRSSAGNAALFRAARSRIILSGQLRTQSTTRRRPTRSCVISVCARRSSGMRQPRAAAALHDTYAKLNTTSLRAPVCDIEILACGSTLAGEVREQAGINGGPHGEGCYHADAGHEADRRRDRKPCAPAPDAGPPLAPQWSSALAARPVNHTAGQIAVQAMIYRI